MLAMTRTAWILRLFQPLKSRQRKQQSKPRDKLFRPSLELLEQRTLLSGNTYTVNALGDSGAGSGTSGDIRYCISQADLNAGSTITFASSLSGQSISLAHGQLNLSADMTITGLGPSSLTISGGGLSRVFDVSSKTAQVAISSLTISGGSISGAGGGIYNKGSLTLNDSSVSGNTASGEGGGIYNAGDVTISSSSTLSGNDANYGGGIFTISGGTLMVSSSTLSGNSAIASGGGVFNSGTLTVTSSSLSSNTAGHGGGIRNDGTATVSDSSLSGNSAANGGAILNLNGLTVNASSSLSSNSASGDGAAIFNSSTATVGGSTLKSNSALNGGGIYNAGTVTVNGSSLLSNSTDGIGGGIYGGGSVTVSNGSTLSSNSARYGGGIFVVRGKSLSVSSSTLSGNSASYTGGGVFNSGTVAINNSTLSGNSGANAGGGIQNYATLTVTNSTLYNNTGANGGGLLNYNSGTATLTNATIADNTATIRGGGIDVASGDVLLHNTLVAENFLGGIETDVHGSLDSASDYNLISDGSGGLTNGVNGNIVSTSFNAINPVLSSLGNYGGTTETLALLPGSPAIDAGSNSYGGGFDQRGEATFGNLRDIGAFESQGFTLALTSGNNQVGNLNAAFTNPLVVTVTANNSAEEPVAGGLVTFTAPTSGASATLSNGTDSGTSVNATIAADGTASVTATANNIGGPYTVTASANGVAGTANFSLNNGIVVTTLLDSGNPSGTTSLRQAISEAETDGITTITFDPSILQPGVNVIDLKSELPHLTGNLTIQGPGASVLTVKRDSSAPSFTVFTVNSGATATLSGLTISGGLNGPAGGIYNGGVLTVSDSTVSGNSATFSGGGFYNAGTLTINNSSVSGNSATSQGGGVYSNGSLSVNDSILSGNSATEGGGICDVNLNLTVSDSTLSGNSAVDGGGLYFNSFSLTATLTNATIANNIASSAGGGIDISSGDVLLQNTLVAENMVGNGESDVSGSLDSVSSYNLIGDGSGGLTFGSNGNIEGNPLLSSLGNYGGTTNTLALLPGSPAIGAGDPSGTSGTDQRGVSRNQTAGNDIGAFVSQGFTIAVTNGNNQSTAVNTAFPDDLVVTVADPNGEPVVGGQVTYTAPNSGASATFTGNPATIASNGQASVQATANGTTGSYTVTAKANGVSGSGDFTLTND
jgi:hypothetical protein